MDRGGRTHPRRSQGAAHDYFGSVVSISGNTIAVLETNGTGVVDQSAVYMFAEPVAGWHDMTPTAVLTAYNSIAGDNFGSSLAVSGNSVVVGDVNFDTEEGVVDVFTEPASGWATTTMPTATLVPADATGYGFGGAVAIDGNTVVVRAPFATDPAVNYSSQGSAYVFTEPASGWANMTQTAELTASDGAAWDCFGNAVAVSGNTVVVGASSAENLTGAAYVFVEPPFRLGNHDPDRETHCSWQFLGGRVWSVRGG